MANDKHARLVYLSDVLFSLGMLTFVADQWLSPKECNSLATELEPIVRDLVAKIEARVPELVLPFSLECEPRIDEIVEFELKTVRAKLARIERVKATFGA
jgi:hypothetical protein